MKSNQSGGELRTKVYIENVEIKTINVYTCILFIVNVECMK